MDPFEEIRYLGWDLEDVEDFENSPSHLTLSERLEKTLYLTEGCGSGMSLPVADTAVELFQEASGSPLKQISPRHVANLSKRSRVAPCTLLLAMIYARRLKTMNEDYLKNMTAPDLLLVSMMVASKFLYDEGEDEEMFSDEWASAANVDLNRVYELEREFLSAMDWNLFVHNEEFFEFIRDFETRIALSQGIRRGWFSYSDMEILMAQAGWRVSCNVVMHQALRVLAVCAAVYTVCATTLIWSSLVMRHKSLHAPCPDLWLDAQQVQKSTLMHHPLSPLPLPNAGKCLASGVKELAPLPCNGSEAVDGCIGEEEIRTDMTSAVWELTSALNQKYHAARNALAIFYQALITSLHDVSDGYKDQQRECREVGPSGATAETCVCCLGHGSTGGCQSGRCVAERLNGTASGSSDGPCHRYHTRCTTLPEPKMNASTTCCLCQKAMDSDQPGQHMKQGSDCHRKGTHYHPKRNCMGHSKSADGPHEGSWCGGHSGCPTVPYDTAPLLPDWRNTRGKSCITPDLLQRFVDLHTRFATISY